MKLKIAATAATLLCCLSCVNQNYELGGNLLPIDQSYSIYYKSLPIPEIYSMMTDSLPGFSQTSITIGAIRDEHFGLTTRGCALTLVPLYDTLDFGAGPVVKNFHFSADLDTTDVLYDAHKYILQNIKAYPLKEPVNMKKDLDGNTPVPHLDESIIKGTAMFNGDDSLSFNFTDEYATKYLSITQEDLEDIDKYLAKFPGIYIETNEPAGLGGRINRFNLQLGYDSSDASLSSSYATLTIETMYDHWDERGDTTFYFYYSPLEMYDLDSLLTNSSYGSFPQYCRNYTGHETRDRAGLAKDEELEIEGGGGLKPMIKASTLRALAEQMISEETSNLDNVVINRATIVLPFTFPDDYEDMDFFPYILSPACRLLTDTTATFMGLSDSSDSNENQGEIDRANLEFAPDITYHLQELLKIKDTDSSTYKKYKKGMYDIWFLITANEVVESGTSSSSSNELSEYYQYLAYQSYYSSMYGGGYSSYGNSYSNYYTYMMMAQMYSSSGTTTSTTQSIDVTRYYYGRLNAPGYPDKEKVPTLELMFSVPVSDSK